MLFARPRRFGKSLWISILQHYYDVQFKDEFDFLFGKYYIGQNPTPDRNNYIVLRFQSYPKKMLDTNIASDYTKVRKIFVLNSKEETQLNRAHGDISKALFTLAKEGQTKEKTLNKIIEDARQQLKNYLQTDDAKRIDNLKAWLLILVGRKWHLVEEVTA